MAAVVSCKMKILFFNFNFNFSVLSEKCSFMIILHYYFDYCALGFNQTLDHDSYNSCSPMPVGWPRHLVKYDIWPSMTTALLWKVVNCYNWPTVATGQQLQLVNYDNRLTTDVHPWQLFDCDNWSNITTVNLDNCCTMTSG